MTDTQRADKIRIYVWDAPTRLFHWLVVLFVVVAWITGEEENLSFSIHIWAGYGVLAALVFRVIWGFAGSRHARFDDFLRPWRVVRDYTRNFLAFKPPHSVGHNPLGGWMIVLLLLMLAALVVTGLFAAEEEEHAEVAGPLAHYVSIGLAEAMAEAHEVLFNVLLVLVGIHILGVLVDTVLTGDNLVWAMVTGYKTVAPAEQGAAAAPPPVSRAAMVLAVAIILTLLVATL